MAQKAVSAIAATVVEAPSSLVMSSCDQLPLTVSQTPYRTANAAKTQNRAGIPPRARSGPAGAALSARSGSGMLPRINAASRAAESTGNPHQKPSPTKMATKTGASAVPSPSKAFRASTDVATASGWNAAVKVFSDGTDKPKPSPRNAVATSKSGSATDVSDSKNWLTISSDIE